MPLGGRRRGVLRRRRDLDPERLAQPQRPGLFHNPLPQLLLSHAGKLHRPLATLQHIRHLSPYLTGASLDKAQRRVSTRSLDRAATSLSTLSFPSTMTLSREPSSAIANMSSNMAS